MPAPKRDSIDDFFAQLEPHQRAHLEELRRISLDYPVEEALRWNQPGYMRGSEQMWMLQAYAKHCSLRFVPDFFEAYADEVKAAGYEAGAGFLKILYAQEVPEQLCRRLIEARLAGA
ncbi:MAG: DUF1801 domain-containing protein [Candidatus Leucobacter sulfamidivorax]|nr:DUF1801 domain-containing protein [Candidatus Leucobacter sulfamidivorax]